MIPLTNEENEFYEKQKVCRICKEARIGFNRIMNKNCFISSNIYIIITIFTAKS